MHLHLPSSRKETFTGSAAADAPAHWDAPDGTRVVQANHSILSDFHTPVNASFWGCGAVRTWWPGRLNRSGSVAFQGSGDIMNVTGRSRDRVKLAPAHKSSLPDLRTKAKTHRSDTRPLASEPTIARANCGLPVHEPGSPSRKWMTMGPPPTPPHSISSTLDRNCRNISRVDDTLMGRDVCFRQA